MLKRLLSTALFVAVFSFFPLKVEAQNIRLACKHLDVISQSFLNLHVTFDKMTDNLEKRMIDQYIKRMDGAKMYLLQSDIPVIQAKLKGITKAVKSGQCGAIDEVQALYVKRVEDRAAYAKTTL